ncbi:MAG TPA: carboxypeptidase-like regulatory domain-containing protein [Candidatus Acidoferrales bacterium]|nr:carboxypeptidase-like regulatory domain-containing protein [Candidatus Acidoferrales bacterium]
MWRAAVLGLLLVSSAGAACKCQLTLSACREAASSEVIFIGTVQSIEPTFLDLWNPSQPSSLAQLNQEYERAQDAKDGEGFGPLRDAYLKVFPDLPAEHKKRLQTAASRQELTTLFYWILDHGKRVRLRVKTLYRNGDDDADDDAPKTMEVWTAFGECGVHFQVGETYLVYADADEESDVITTDACSRTRRLSDAGDDLAYLYYWKNFGDDAARLEGFVTSDLLYQRGLDLTHYSDRIGAPAPGIVVQLKGPDRTRYAETDERGRFVFDGLPEATYTLTGFAAGYPAVQKAATAPKEVRMEKKACASEVLIAPKGGGQP